MTAILLNQSIPKTTEKLYLNEDLSDVHFLFNIDGAIQKVPAHKLILAMKSTVFKAMFFGPMKEQSDIEIVDAGIHVFKEFLKLFYLSDVMLSMESMAAVIRLADKYDIMDGVGEMCETLSKQRLTSANVFYIYQLASYADHFPLIKACERLICNSHVHQSFQLNQFLRIDKKILFEVLEMRLNCDELVLIFTCLIWAIYACNKQKCERNGENLRAALDDCVRLLRFWKLDLIQFANIDANYTGLLTPEEFQEVIIIVIQLHNGTALSQCTAFLFLFSVDCVDAKSFHV